MKTVVVVGGGISGLKLIKDLSNNKEIKLILIEPKDYIEVPYAQLRALVEPQTFSPKIREKYSVLIKNVQHIMTKAKKIDDNKLILANKEEVSFDYLVIATGTSFRNWPYLKSSVKNIEKRQKEVEESALELENASSVLIIGGGSVGVELAGEIAYKYKNKEITIVDNNPRILNGLNEKMTKRSTEILNDMGVKIINNTRLIKDKEGFYKDKTGKKYQADIIYQAVGVNINSNWVKTSNIPLNERKAIEVEPDLRVKGYNNIFAIGDINDVPELKLGALATMQAGLTAKNIVKLINDPEKPLKKYKPSKPMSFIPIGKKLGAVQLPFGHPHFLISIKQKDLFVSRTLKH
ncbi:MAG: NAD(P)/FAD-dependent oxidoreductase [Pleomorphochaeta sp.]